MKFYFAAKVLKKISLIQEIRQGLRVHSKGIGAICRDNKGIPSGTYLGDYLGEVYPI
jgi:hypothetical protein